MPSPLQAPGPDPRADARPDPHPTGQKVFLLGVGAQKAGTTWMFDYLSRHPGAAMGRIKEYAIFDPAAQASADHLRSRMHLRSLREALQTRLDALAPPGRVAGKTAGAAPGDTAGGDTAEAPPQAGALPDPQPLLDLMDNVALALDPGRAPWHFDRLLAERPGATVTGDITPAYAMLQSADFERIRTLMEAHGYRVKVVFLLRDPVERCWSAQRMHDRNVARGGKPPRQPAHERFARDALSPWSEGRTRYDRTLAALEAVFDPGDIFCALYEEFVSDSGVRALTGFLGLDHHPPALAHRANASPRSGPEPDAAAIARVRAHYAPVYDFCAARFGAARLARLWPHAERR